MAVAGMPRDDTGRRETLAARASDSGEHIYRYVFVESEELPRIDLSKSLRSALLLTRLSKAVAAGVKTFFVPISLYHLRRTLLGIVICFLDASIARALAPITVVCIPVTLSVLPALRYDILSLLLRAYEFWFFAPVCVFTSVLVGLHFGDAHTLTVPTILLGALSSVLVDANIPMHGSFVVGTASAGAFMLVLIVYVTFGLIDEAHQFVLFELGTRSLSVRDALVNGWDTLIVLTCRNV